METTEKKQFMDEFKNQWKNLWRYRVDDNERAEGIADKDYTLLFVDRGTVIIATRKFRVLDFYEILQQHKLLVGDETIPPNPSVGGWGKFIRTALTLQSRTKRGRQVPSKPDKRAGLQLKKSGRGWLHYER